MAKTKIYDPLRLKPIGMHLKQAIKLSKITLDAWQHYLRYNQEIEALLLQHSNPSLEIINHLTQLRILIETVKIVAMSGLSYRVIS